LLSVLFLLVRLTLLIHLVLPVIGVPLLSVLFLLVRLTLLIHLVLPVIGALVYLVRFEYQNRTFWFNKSKPKINSIYYVCSNKKNGCRGSISLDASDPQSVLRETNHSCIKSTDFQVTAVVRFDELMTTVQDSTKKSVKIHQLWCEFHRNLTLIDLIPSSIVD